MSGVTSPRLHTAEGRASYRFPCPWCAAENTLDLTGFTGPFDPATIQAEWHCEACGKGFDLVNGEPVPWPSHPARIPTPPGDASR